MKFTESQKQAMNKNQPISDKHFDDIIINKDIIAFDKEPSNHLYDAYSPSDPYGEYNNTGDEFESVPKITDDPILTHKGDKLIHQDIQEIYDNQKRAYSKRAMNLNYQQFDKLTDDINLNDMDLNDNLKYDLKDKHNIDTSVQYSDGKSINHPEIYQRTINSDANFGLGQAGSLDEEEFSDGVSLNDGYASDTKDAVKAIKKHPNKVNAVITNYTKPIMNNEEGITDAQTATYYLAGREETNHSAGIYLVGANTSHNRKQISKILKKYAPDYLRDYQNEIKPYAQNISLSQRNLGESVKKELKHDMKEMKHDKALLAQEHTFSSKSKSSSFNNHVKPAHINPMSHSSIEKKHILQLKRHQGLQR